MTATERMAVKEAIDRDVRSRIKGKLGSSAKAAPRTEVLHRLPRREQLSVFHALNVEVGGPDY